MKLILFIALVLLVSCTSNLIPAKHRALFKQSKTIKTFSSVANMNDAWFVLKENNYFEFYRLLFDSVKNSSYPGRYKNSGDTLLLDFFDKKGTTTLGAKAIINHDSSKITFFK